MPAVFCPTQFLKECDEIVVMKDGAIAEQGSPDQLLASGKEYANLITLFTEEHDANTEISTGVDRILLLDILHFILT